MKTLQNLRDKALSYQIELVNELQSHGLNIICCNNCGNILLHKTASIIEDEDEEAVLCDSCLTEVYPNDCCDYLYDGMSSSENFEGVFNNNELLKRIDEVNALPNNSILKKQQYKPTSNTNMIFIIYVKGIEFEYDSEKDRNKDFKKLRELFNDKFIFE